MQAAAPRRREPTTRRFTGGTLTFAAGETSKTIPVEVRGDSAVEPDETVRVRIDSPNPSGTPIRGADGAIAMSAVGTGTIATDEATSPRMVGSSAPPVASMSMSRVAR